MLAGAPVRPPASLAELLPPDLSARLDALDVFSRKVFAGKLQGERRSKRRGRSVEFEEHREYVPGDDLRHIDWNVYARLDRFFIKLFQEEEDLGLELLLDASPSMNAGRPSKLLFAARLAVALGYIGLIRNNRVSLTILGAAGSPHGRRLAPVRGRQSVQRLGRFIIEHAFSASAAPESDTDRAAPVSPSGAFTAACRGVASSRQGKGVVVLLSDLLIPPPEGYETGVKLLAAPTALGSAFDVYCLQVLSPGELDPSVEGRTASADEPDALPIIGDLALTDVETGRIAEVTVTAEVIDAYKRSVRRYIDSAAAFCTAGASTHVLVPSDADVGTIVLDSLRRRGLLR